MWHSETLPQRGRSHPWPCTQSLVSPRYTAETWTASTVSSRWLAWRNNYQRRHQWGSCEHCAFEKRFGHLTLKHTMATLLGSYRTNSFHWLYLTNNATEDLYNTYPLKCWWCTTSNCIIIIIKLDSKYFTICTSCHIQSPFRWFLS